MSLETLKESHPYPEVKPDLPFDDHGWFSEHNKTLFKPLLGESKVFVEIGSWLGLSTRFWLQNTKAHVICIDTWRGSSEHVLREEWRNRLPKLFETFSSNQWAWRDRITPIRATSLEGLEIIKQHQVNPDFIYLDASHEVDDVIADLTLAHSLFPQAGLIGDDWNYIHKFDDRRYKTVQVAVKQFCETMGLSVEANSWAWRIT